MFKGEDYLCKMLHDIDFIYDGLKKPPFYRADPLIIIRDVNIDTGFSLFYICYTSL